MVLASSQRDMGTSRFPLGLLAIGYTTGALAAVIVHLQAGGLLSAILTFWLGGAVATLAWGSVLISVGARKERRQEPAAAFEPAATVSRDSPLRQAGGVSSIRPCAPRAAAPRPAP